MNIVIEKISNGYILTLNGLKTFCDVPEAICGLTSEWVLAECRKLEQPRAGVDSSEYAKHMEIALQQMEAAHSGVVAKPLLRSLAERLKHG